ncbi:MAG TPA: hypothetical protein VIY27_08760 [Myxococcota bacterium]
MLHASRPPDARSSRLTRRARPPGCRRLGRAWLLTALAGLPLLAAPAQASPQTLRRSLGNLLFAPFDLVLSPVVAARSIYRNLRSVDDSRGVRAFYVVPGFAWNTGVQGMAAVVREITGLIEFAPGLCVFFLEADLAPLYAPVERGDALLDLETPPLRIKLGVDYITVSG